MNPKGWKNNTKLFLIQNQLRFTYGDFFEAVRANKYYFTSLSEDSLILEAGNHFLSYARFIGALLAGKTVLLYPSAKTTDLTYLNQIRHEMGRPSLYLPLNAKTSASGPADITDLCVGHFIVRTSGSSGPMFKLVLHETERFIQKYNTIGSHFEMTMAFSPAETIAGIETLLEVLSLEKSLVTPEDDLTPEHIVDLIEAHKIDYFQTTPSFMNLLIISKSLKSGKLEKLQKIAYGSEPSVSQVLHQFKFFLPDVKLVQTYGMSEIGIQKTITDPGDATRFTLDERYNPFRIIDGILHVRSMTRLLRYLNATAEQSSLGAEWFCTQDEAVVENGYLKVLGRKGDLINIGGRKFFPIELEEKLQQMQEVRDVIVTSEKNEIIGSVITATIILSPEADEAEFRKAYKLFCEKNIVSYMHPHRLKLVKNQSMPPVLKKMRKL